MRITIDTELKVIIVPNSYYDQIDHLNDIISAANGTKLDYVQFIKDCFKLAIDTKIIRQCDVAQLSTHKRKSSKKNAKHNTLLGSGKAGDGK